jgi:phosphoglycerol transferase MdoB-like AlkP superfamily enzyme
MREENKGMSALLEWARVRTRGRPPFAFLGAYLVSAWLVRLVLLELAWPHLDVGLWVALGLLGRSMVLDLASAAYLLAPIFLYFSLMPTRIQQSRLHRKLVQMAYAGWLFGLLFGIAAEVVFWNEFEARWNFIAVNYLVYTQEVLGNLVESFPMGKILLGLALLTAVVFWATQSFLKMSSREAGSRRTLLAMALLGPLLAWSLVDGELSRGSQNHYANELTKNGVYSFFSAYWKNKIEYVEFYPVSPREEVLERLRRLVEPDPQVNFLEKSGIARQIDSGPETRRNVMLLLVESLGTEFLGSFGCAQGLTPKLDDLRKRSRVYTRMFANGTRTVRGLEAVTLSIPPTPGNSLVRQPHNEDMNSIAWPLRKRGYETRFLYGGYGYFDNMNYFMSHNGFDAVDRTDMEPEEVIFGNVWGVCDGDLLGRALREADRSFAAQHPFFQLVLTTSNHRPYTYPEEIDIPSGTGRGGAVKYTDHALGRFLKEAEKHPWFENTIFVILGDHGAASSGKIDVPVYRYHIPCFVYAPKIIPPGDDNRLCSQMDLAPTLMGLLGGSYRSTFFGADLGRYSPNRALVSTYDTLGLYRDNRLLLLRPRAKPEAWDVSNLYQAVATKPREKDLQDAVAYYQGASLLREEGALQRQGPAPGTPVVFRR